MQDVTLADDSDSRQIEAQVMMSQLGLMNLSDRDLTVAHVMCNMSIQMPQKNATGCDNQQPAWCCSNAAVRHTLYQQ